MWKGEAGEGWAGTKLPTQRLLESLGRGWAMDLYLGCLPLDLNREWIVGVAGMEVERWVRDNCMYQRPWNFVYSRESTGGKKEEDLGVERTCCQLGHELTCIWTLCVPFL